MFHTNVCRVSVNEFSLVNLKGNFVNLGIVILPILNAIFGSSIRLILKR